MFSSYEHVYWGFGIKYIKKRTQLAWHGANLERMTTDTAYIEGNLDMYMRTYIHTCICLQFMIKHIIYYFITNMFRSLIFI